jgi:coenzyme F420-0:L-glutamate ligase/coenzyme F420-1:gamma-L-glutamate ligase
VNESFPVIEGNEQIPVDQLAEIDNTNSDISFELHVLPIKGIPEIKSGDDLTTMLLERAKLHDGDVVVVTQKIVSKAEGRVVPIDPMDSNGKLKLVKAEAKRVLRQRGELLITETHHGFICANAGVDLSNIADGYAALLPVNPDRSARRIRDKIRRITGLSVAVIISDTFGRAWRRGVTDIAIGSAGIAAVLDLRGSFDAMGKELKATEICIADEIAGAAELVMSKSRQIPAAIVRGIDKSWFQESSVKSDIIRPATLDLFR